MDVFIGATVTESQSPTCCVVSAHRKVAPLMNSRQHHIDRNIIAASRWEGAWRWQTGSVCPFPRCQDRYRTVASHSMAKKAQVTWGGRFSQAPADLMLRFSESVSFDSRLAPFDIQGSKA